MTKTEAIKLFQEQRVRTVWDDKEEINMLAELSTTSITRAKNPQGLEENAQCAAEGGNVAAVARRELESKTGRSVVSPLSARRFFEAQKDRKQITKQSDDTNDHGTATE